MTTACGGFLPSPQLWLIHHSLGLNYYARVDTTGAEGQGLVKFACELGITVEEKVEFMPGTYYNP